MTLDLLKQSIDFASVPQHVTEDQSIQMQAMKLAAITITLEELKKCSQLVKVVGFVNECLLELHEVSR